MIDSKDVLDDLINNKKFNDIHSLMNCLHSVLRHNMLEVDSIACDLIDKDLMLEIQRLTSNCNIPVYFGKTLRELKIVVVDEENSRQHEIFVQYKGPKKLCASPKELPYSALQDQEYNSLEEIVNTYKTHLDNLSGYFYELDNIDRYCTVMDPVLPSYKEDYRRILLDDRTWLHVEITPHGVAINVHLMGQSEHWQDKLQSGILNWDHDKDIVQNIMTIFEIDEFPVITKLTAVNTVADSNHAGNVLECSICLCSELPDDPGVPQPLCQNPRCGVHFHRSCLYQWLVACAGGRPPALGVSTGSCPSCLQSIACNENN